MVMAADWRYQYHVENDSDANQEKLKRWRSQGSELKMSPKRKFPWSLVVIAVVVAILLWVRC